MSLISLSRMFKKLCAKVIDPNTTQVLKLKVVEIMSTLKKIFPPTSFDVMTHLVIHLVEELELCTLIHTRWMYPMEWYMKALKGYIIRNMARPEGNMATRYSVEETLGLYIEYFQGVKSTRRTLWDDKEEPTMHDELLEEVGALVE